MKKEKTKGYDDLCALQAAVGAIEFRQDAYLRKMGWEYTCDNPGSLWLWFKVVTFKRYTREGPIDVTREYRCNVRTALAIQSSLEDSGEDFDDESNSRGGDDD